MNQWQEESIIQSSSTFMKHDDNWKNLPVQTTFLIGIYVCVLVSASWADKSGDPSSSLWQHVGKTRAPDNVFRRYILFGGTIASIVGARRCSVSGPAGQKTLWSSWIITRDSVLAKLWDATSSLVQWEVFITIHNEVKKKEKQFLKARFC